MPVTLATAQQGLSNRLIKSLDEVGEAWPLYAGADGVWVTTDAPNAWSGLYAWGLYQAGKEMGREDVTDAAQLRAHRVREGYPRNGAMAPFNAYYAAACFWDAEEDSFARAHALSIAWESRAKALSVCGAPPLLGTLVPIQTLGANTLLDWWALEETKEEMFQHGVFDQMDLAQMEFLRDDFSCYEQVEVDPDTGEAIRLQHDHAYDNESCWARGQAWAVHGFVTAFLNSQDETYLESAKSAFLYYWTQCQGKLPAYDFKAPLPEGQRPPKDALAAAIILVSLKRLSKVPALPDSCGPLLRAAEIIQASLLEEAHYDMASDTVRLGCCTLHYKEEAQVGVETIAGDLFLMEALSL